MAFTTSIALIFLTAFISAFIVTPSNGLDAPSKLSKFHPVLKTSKLQKNTKGDVPSSTLLGDYKEWFFYLDGQVMTFKMKGSSKRSELRQMKSGGKEEAAWSVRDTHELSARIAIPKQESAINEMTILQIHCSASVPALRISFVKSAKINGETRNDYIIATVRNGKNKDSPTEKFFLHPRHTDFLSYSLSVASSQVNISVGPENKSIDLSVWNQSQCYFKAGAYINNPSSNDATGVSRFSSLTWN